MIAIACVEAMGEGWWAGCRSRLIAQLGWWMAGWRDLRDYYIGRWRGYKKRL